MTFSIVARCAETGMFGMAVSSSSPAVAARCAHVRAGAGAVASQNVTDPSLGMRALDLLALGAGAEQVIAILQASSQHMAYRQVMVVDGLGHAAIHSGPNALGIWSSAKSDNVACGGNMLADAGVPDAMVEAFTKSTGHLGDRLVLAMQAGLAAGGEAGPVHSAGMKIAQDVVWPIADLRVDWTDDCPIAALDSLWTLYKPQLNDYLARALNPAGAPKYGVPGDQ